MKKIVLSLALCSVFGLNLAAAEEAHAEHEKEAHAGTSYIALKVLHTFGNSKQEEDRTLEGDPGNGIAIDIGHKIAMGFAVELDVTYGTTDIIETASNGERESATAEYMTSSLDIAYFYEVMHGLEVFGKVGYEYETEKISKLDVDKSDTGFIYAAGMEYDVYKEDVALILEYEMSTIDGPRGDSAYAGFVYRF